MVSENRYAEAWTYLYPAQQRLVLRERYAVCEQLTPIPGRLVSIRATRVWQDSIGTVVSFRLRIAGAPVQEGVPVTVTAHAVRTEGHWAWLLPRERLARYRADRCPAYPEPQQANVEVGTQSGPTREGDSA